MNNSEEKELEFYFHLKDYKQPKEYAIHQLKNLAEKKKVDAMTILAKLCLTGESLEPKNEERAIQLLTYASEKKYSLADIELGKCYYHGIGVEKDIEKAEEYFVKAIKRRHPLGLYNLAKMKYEIGYKQFKQDENNIELLLEANSYFERLVNFYTYRRKCTTEQKDLAIFYKFYWARSLRGTSRMASRICYRNLMDCKVSNPELLPEKLNIVDGIIIDAMYELAECYESVNENDRAIHWYIKAGALNFEPAINRIREISQLNIPQSVPAKLFLEAIGGDSDSALKLSECYEEGGPLLHSMEDSYYWYKYSKKIK